MVREVLAANAGQPGHVFNLGWGVLPHTDPDALRRVVDVVHAEGGEHGDGHAEGGEHGDGHAEGGEHGDAPSPATTAR
jgi:hypothetical protein